MTRVRGGAGQYVERAASFVDKSPAEAEPALEPELARAIGGLDVVVAQKALAALSAEERARLFETPIGEQKLPPLLDAVRRGLPQFAALFGGMRAALGVQTPAGLNAVHVALQATQPGTARTLLTTPELRDGLIDTTRVSLDSVRDKLAKIPRRPKDADLDRVALSITGGSPRLLTSGDQLSLYCAHIKDADDVPGIIKAEGWNVESALEMRVRTLVGMVAKARSDRNRGLREALIREIAVTTEALQVERRVDTITSKADPELARLALDHECEGILRKLDDALAMGGDERTHLLIPVSNQTHTMYLELEPRLVNGVKHYQLRFDNRGYFNGTHTQKGSKVYPICTVVPATQQMRDALKTLCVDMLAKRNHGAGGVEAIYDAMNHWLTSVVARLGPEAVPDPRDSEVPADSQAVGNCTIANLQPGTSRRLGRYASAFHDFEYADARERRRHANSEDLFDAAIERAQEKAAAKRAEMDTKAD